MRGKIVEVTITTSTSIYASGDQIGVEVELPGACNAGEPSVLRSLTVIDKSKQKADLDILLFDEDPTNAVADNAAADISDAEMADKAIGIVSVATGSYKDLTANSIATISPGLMVRGSTLYALVVCRGTPTYTGTSDLVLKAAFDWG